MISWRMETTVLTDLSASIFAVCFTILLVFIGLADRDRVATKQPATRTVEASSDLRTVRRQPLAPATMIEHLYQHGHSQTQMIGIDLFTDRVEVRSGARRMVLDGFGLEEKLTERMQSQARLPVRLYVFANDLYADVLASLEQTGTRWTEMSVPNGLMADDGTTGWSQAFLDLDASNVAKDAFRTRLALLLAGSARSSPAGVSVEAKGTAVQSASRVAAPLTSSLRDWWNASITGISRVLPVVGFAVVLLIRRRHPDLALATFSSPGDALGWTARPNSLN